MIYGQIRKGIKPEMYALSTLIFLMVTVILIVVNTVSEKHKDRLNKEWSEEGV